MTLVRSPLHPRHRWRDAPQPRASRLAAHEAVAAGLSPRAVLVPRASRRRRLVTRALPALVALGVLGLLLSWAVSPGGMSPDAVASAAHDQVLRDVIRRTGDYSARIGPLACIELEPGQGNCLADLRTAAHRSDALMVSVGYVVDPGDGQLELVVKLP